MALPELSRSIASNTGRASGRTRGSTTAISAPARSKALDIRSTGQGCRFPPHSDLPSRPNRHPLHLGVQSFVKAFYNTNSHREVGCCIKICGAS